MKNEIEKLKIARYPIVDILQLAQIKDRNLRSIAPIDQRDIIEESKRMYKHVHDILEYIHDLALLEGMYILDEFYDTKEIFSNSKMDYGYINTSVRRDNGSNYFRFYKKKTASKYEKLWLNPAKKEGKVTDKQFNIHTSHQEDLQNCIDTEAQYCRLRKQSSICRDTIRRIKALEIMGDIFKDSSEDDTDDIS